LLQFVRRLGQLSPQRRDFVVQCGGCGLKFAARLFDLLRLVGR
jgi:hypothetical protein